MKQAKWDAFTAEAQDLFEKHGIDACWQFDDRDGDGQFIIYTGVYHGFCKGHNDALGDTDLDYLEGS